MSTPVDRPALDATALAARGADVLRGNDLGPLVTAGPRLYPHMWSWDAAFIAIGLAQLDIRRALTELRTLLDAQWRNGMLPHIRFSSADGYFPGPDRWGTDISPDAPREPRTSGICQPPVHAIALQRILDVADQAGGADRAHAEDFAVRVWPALFAWHRWLAEHRDPAGTGLIALVHGWESGMDNSPRWDAAYRGVRPGRLPAYTRRDVALVGGDDERPHDEEYDRYLWLIEEMRDVRYDAAEVYRTSSFLVTDVFTTAIFAVASDVLAAIGARAGQPSDDVERLRHWAQRSRLAVAETCHSATGLATDQDLRSGQWLTEPTIAGFAPLLCGGLAASAEDRLVSLMLGPEWAGHPDLFAAVPPSAPPGSAHFEPKRYWRGPLWPVVVWLFSWALHRRGHEDTAAGLREEGLRLAGDGTFAEYYEPFTAAPLGSLDQSWTAAVVLDWLGAWP